jgi:hypothetical protein
VGGTLHHQNGGSREHTEQRDVDGGMSETICDHRILPWWNRQIPTI